MLKYLELDVADKDAQMESWLAGSWQTPGFRKYLSYRDGRLIYEMAGGSNLTEVGREDYVRQMGMRLEMLALGTHAKNAHIRKEKERKEKMT